MPWGQVIFRTIFSSFIISLFSGREGILGTPVVKEFHLVESRKRTILSLPPPCETYSFPRGEMKLRLPGFPERYEKHESATLLEAHIGVFQQPESLPTSFNKLSHWFLFHLYLLNFIYFIFVLQSVLERSKPTAHFRQQR